MFNMMVLILLIKWPHLPYLAHSLSDTSARGAPLFLLFARLNEILLQPLNQSLIGVKGAHFFLLAKDRMVEYVFVKFYVRWVSSIVGLADDILQMCTAQVYLSKELTVKWMINLTLKMILWNLINYHPWTKSLAYLSRFKQNWYTAWLIVLSFQVKWNW